MASSDAWNAGWSLGAGLAGERYLQKQARANELWEDRLNELNANITSLQTKYPSLLGPNGEDTPASLKVKYALTQAALARDEFENPPKGPGAFERLERLLHLTRTAHPQTPTVAPETLQPTAAVQQAAPSQSMAAPPASTAVAPKAALTPRQLRQQAQANLRAGREAARLLAAAPLSPGQEAAQTLEFMKQQPWWGKLTPQQQTEAELSAFGVKPITATMREYTSPDGKQRDWFVPGEEPPGWQATAGARGTGKSPPLAGDKLPADAVGPDGEPIPASDRVPGRSFVLYQDAWWPLAPKPVFKILRGHDVLADPQTGAILRDFGSAGTVRVTKRQEMQPGDDGQMHLVTLTSVSTPEGESIDVEPETAAAPAEPEKPAKPTAVASGAQRKPPTTPAKPSTAGGVVAPVVPGFSALAHSKDPVYKSYVAQFTKASEDAEMKHKVYLQAKGLLDDPKRVTDLELIFAWVRSNVQGAGRLTNTEITLAGRAGNYGTRIQSAIDIATKGRLAPELEQQFLADIKRAYEAAQQDADDLKNRLQSFGSPEPAGPGAPPPGATVVRWKDLR